MRRLTGRTPHLDETAWPALSRNPPSTSTPAPPKNSKQAAGTKMAPPTPLPRTKRPAQASKYSDSMGIPLKNRFSALQPEPLSENPPSNINNEAKPSHPPHTLSPKDKVTTRKTKGMQRVLIVGDEAVNGISHVCNPKKTRVISFLGDTVSDLTRKVLSLTADQPNMETLVVHIGANDLAKQKSEILKKDFNILLDTMGKLKMKLFLSGPIPSPQWGDEKHFRLGMINKWLIKTCSASSVTFIDNLWIYWQRFHLFGRGGCNLNKHGIRLLTANIFLFINKNSNVTIASEELAQGCLTRMEASAYQEPRVPKQPDRTTGERTTGSQSLKRVGLHLSRLKMLVEDPGQRGRRTDSSSSQQYSMDQQVRLGTSLRCSNIADLTSSKPPASDLPEDPALCVSEV
uniref:SGNH hydrolase-type esterase domain-containing protein n=1 Tax=Poecilia formosa TaxID=48698 RepID=A0A096M322_POEFO